MDEILQRILRLVPILIIGLIIMGMIMFVITAIVPSWNNYQLLNTQLEAAKQTLSNQPDDSADAMITVLQRQIQKAQDGMQQAVSIFMTDDQAHNILDNLYAYAAQSGVQITTLQAQQSSQGSATTNTQPTKQNNGNQTTTAVVDPSTIYAVQAFRLLVDGKVPGLMAFVTRIREATIAGVMISNLSLKDNKDQATLTMDVLIFSSPLSTGSSYENIPAIELPSGFSAPVVNLSGTPAAPTDNTTVAVTPNGVATTEPEPQLTLFLSDSFDSGDLSHWNLGAGWYLTGDTAGQVLEVKDSSSDLTLAYNTLKDSAVQARVWLDTGGIRISLRQSAAGRYSVTLDSLGLVALYRGQNLIQTSFSSTSGVARWRTLRLSAVQGVIRVSVDDVELLHIKDSSELPPGTVSFAMTGRGSVRVDDIQIWVLNPADVAATPAP